MSSPQPTTSTGATQLPPDLQSLMDGLKKQGMVGPSANPVSLPAPLLAAVQPNTMPPVTRGRFNHCVLFFASVLNSICSCYRRRFERPEQLHGGRHGHATDAAAATARDVPGVVRSTGAGRRRWGRRKLHAAASDGYAAPAASTAPTTTTATDDATLWWRLPTAESARTLIAASCQ